MRCSYSNTYIYKIVTLAILERNSDGLSVGAIVGIVVSACVVAVSVLAIVTIICAVCHHQQLRPRPRTRPSVTTNAARRNGRDQMVPG